MLAFAVDLARRAGESTLEAFKSGVAVELKADNSPVTEADRQAEMFVRKAIQTEFPAHGVFGEEFGQQGSQEQRWVIDPIDGTKSFIAGVPLFGTLLSYEEAGIPQIGVVSLPALGVTVYAEKGHGAFVDGQPCHVSTQTEFSQAYMVTSDLKQFSKTGRTTHLLELVGNVAAVRTWGDAYATYLMATGRVDLFVDPSFNPWDVSALNVIIEEAGGRVTDFEGNPTPRTCAVCSNGILHDQLLHSLRIS